MPNEGSRVSILIPVFNRVKILPETLESAIKQSYQNIEIVVVDNHSTDGTWELIQEYSRKDSRIRAYQNEENIGPVRNWKRCIDLAGGEYGKILWSDDLIARDFVEKTLPLIDGNEKVGFVFTGAEIFPQKKPKRTSSYLIGPSGLYSAEQFIDGAILGGPYPVSPGCALFRMPDLKKNLMVDVPNKIGSDFAMHAIGNDLLLFLLTAKDYPFFGFVQETLSYFRAHSGSISISSKGGRLPLHYDLAKAFFAEKFRPDVIRKFNVILKRDLFRYKNSVDYGIFSISDFYMDNQDLSVDPFFIAKKISDKILRSLKITQGS